MIRKQRGLTAISWVVIVAVVAAQVIVAMRIIPVYMTFGTVKTVLEAIKTDPDIKGKSPKKIRELINKRLSVNNVYALVNSKDAFKFSKSSSGYNLKLNYEERGPIYGNLQFVATFNYEVELKTK